MDWDKTNDKSTQKIHILCKKAEKHSIIKKVNKRNDCSEASLSSASATGFRRDQNKAENPQNIWNF